MPFEIAGEHISLLASIYYCSPNKSLANLALILVAASISHLQFSFILVVFDLQLHAAYRHYSKLT